MRNTVLSEKRRLRPFYIIAAPFLFLACVIAAACVFTATHEAYLGTLLLMASFGPARMMRWAMVWMSTPGERKLLARNLEHEPVLGLCRTFLKMRGGARLPTAAKCVSLKPNRAPGNRTRAVKYWRLPAGYTAEAGLKGEGHDT